MVNRLIAITIALTCSPREERDGGGDGWGPAKTELPAEFVKQGVPCRRTTSRSARTKSSASSCVSGPKKLGPPQHIEDEVLFDDEEIGAFEGEPGNDPLYEKGIEIVVAQGRASSSYLQRRLTRNGTGR